MDRSSTARFQVIELPPIKTHETRMNMHLSVVASAPPPGCTTHCYSKGGQEKCWAPKCYQQ
jgi:hypothetical protein